MKTLAQHQFGDFQTPVDLACEVTRFLRTSGISPSAVIEPTCGVGNFLVASMRTFGSAFASDLLQQFFCVGHQRSVWTPPRRKDRFRCNGQADCSSVFGLWCGAFCPLALMESADPRLIPPRELFRPVTDSGLAGSWSYLVAITPCRTLRNLSAATSCCAGSCFRQPAL